MDSTGPLRLAAFSPPRADAHDARSSTPVSSREAPACVQNAMMNRDKKPFTYTPGGLDLSEIRSDKLAKRLMKNAMSPGVQEVPKSPQFTPSDKPNAPAANSSAQYCSLPVAVFPCIQIPVNAKELLRKTGSAYNRENSVEQSASDKSSIVSDSVSNNSSQDKSSRLKSPEISPESDKLTVGEKINKFTEEKKSDQSDKMSAKVEDSKNKSSDEKETRLKTFDQFVSDSDPKISETKTNGFASKTVASESEEEEEEEYEEVEEEEEEEEEYSDEPGDEVVNTTKKTVTTTEVKTVVKNEKVVSNQVQEKTTSQDEKTQKENETVSKSEKIISEDEKIIKKEDQIVKYDDQPSEKKDKIECTDEKITQDTKEDNNEQHIVDKVIEKDIENLDNSGKVIVTDDKIKPNENTISKDDKVMPVDDKPENLASTDEKSEDIPIEKTGKKDDAIPSIEDQTTASSDQLKDENDTKQITTTSNEDTIKVKTENISPQEEIKTTMPAPPTPEMEEPIVATLKISPENKILETITTDTSRDSPKTLSEKEVLRESAPKTIEIDTKHFESMVSDLESNRVITTSENFMRRTYSNNKTIDRPAPVTQPFRADPMIGRHSFVKSPSEDRRSVDGSKNLNDLNNIPSLNMCPKRFSFLRDSPPRTTNDPFSILTGISPQAPINQTDFMPMLNQQSNEEVPPPWETESQVPYSMNDNMYVPPQEQPVARSWKCNYAPQKRNTNNYQKPPQQSEIVEPPWKNDQWSSRHQVENQLPTNYIAKEDSGEPSWRRELREISHQKRGSGVEQNEYKEVEEPPWRRELRELSQVRNQRHRSLPPVEYETTWQTSEETQNYSTFTTDIQRAYTPAPSAFVPEIKPTFDARTSPYMADAAPTYYAPANTYTTEVQPPFSSTYGTEVQPPFATSNLYGAEVPPPFATSNTYGAEVPPPFATSNTYGAEVPPPFATSNTYGAEVPPPFATSNTYGAEVPPPFASSNTYGAEVPPPFASSNTYASDVQSSYVPPPAWSQTIGPKSWQERKADLAREKESEVPEWKRTGILRKSFVNSFKKNTQYSSNIQDTYISNLNDMNNQKTPEITVEIANQQPTNRVAPNNNNGYNYPWESSSESSVAFSPEPYYSERTPTPQSRNSPYRPNSQYSAYSYNTSPVVPREYATLSYLPTRRQQVRSCPLQSRSFKYLQLLTGTEDGYEDEGSFVSQPAHQSYLRPNKY